MSGFPLVPLLAGVLIGWVAYFLIDLFFLRRPKPDPRVATLEADIQKCRDGLHAANEFTPDKSCAFRKKSKQLAQMW